MSMALYVIKNVESILSEVILNFTILNFGLESVTIIHKKTFSKRRRFHKFGQSEIYFLIIFWVVLPDFVVIFIR